MIHYEYSFNPCFSGCWSATFPILCGMINNDVSILVLVDVGLRPSEELVFYGIKERFNPCFSGCWSATILNH